jgi:hypothetical protein
MYGSAIVRANIDASVERSFTREGVQALAKSVGDVPKNRPYRRSVSESAKAKAGIIRSPPEETAMAAALRFKKENCSSERSKESWGVIGSCR